MRRTTKFYAAMATLGLIPGLAPAVKAADFDWTKTSSDLWSLAANWTNTPPAGGPDAAGTFVLINTSITAANTVTLFNTGNAGDLIKTVGRLDIGDLTSASHSFTIATGTGSGVLNFDNTGNGRGETNAQLNMLADSRGDTISAPVTLSTSLDITNASPTFALTMSGGITSLGGARSINTSTGLVTLSGVIGNGTGTTSIVQNGTGTVTLSGANTFSGGVTVKQGTVIAGNNAAALGTGAVFIGDTSGNANATLQAGSSQNYTNAITVVGGSSGNTLSLGQTGGAVVFSGGITLNNHLTLFETSGGNNGVNSVSAYLTASNISGTGNLTLAVAGNQSTTNSAAPGGLQTQLAVTGTLSTTGQVINAGTGTGYASITANISNASSVNQNSATSMLGLSGTNTYTGNTNVNAGVLRITTVTALPANNVINVASGGTLQLSISNSTAFGGTATINLAGSGTAYAAGAIETTNTANYTGAVVLQADATVASNFSAGTLTLGGAVTGTGQTLTVTGVGNTTVNAIDTVGGGLIKTGSGVLTMNGATTYTGVTELRNGTIILANANAVGGGGNISFNGGTLQHSASNTVDLASRIANSTGPITINTGGQNVTYAGGINATNTGGLLKVGTAALTLGGTNTYTGLTAVAGGTLRVSGLPVGSIYTDSGGTLQQGDAFAGVQAWLDSGKILTTSTGSIGLNGASSEAINFGSYSELMLGATSNSNYTGTLTASGTTYRLGGGGATLTLSGTNALTGTNSLIVGAANGTSASTGTVAITGANNISGATTLNSGALQINGAAGSLGTSDITANGATTLTITAATTTPAVTRADMVTTRRATFIVTGNNTANSTDVIGGLAIGSGGHSLVTLATGNKNTFLQTGSFSREAGSTALIRGNALGLNAFNAGVATSSNIQVTGPAPTLVGVNGGSGTTVGILVGVVGDSSSTGSGFAATGGLLTYDAATGIRLLTGSEYKTSITDGQTQLDNIKLTNTAATTATTTLDSNTAINSLSLATSTQAAASIVLAGSGTLTINSGVIHSSIASPTTGETIINNDISFNGREGIILSSNPSSSNTTAELQFNGVLGDTGGNGLTIYGAAGYVRFSGSSANTYTGTTIVNGGRLILDKTAGVNAISGDLLINAGTVSYGAQNQIPDTANVVIGGGGTLVSSTDTIQTLVARNGGSLAFTSGSGTIYNVTGNATATSGGELGSNVAGQLSVGGSLSLSDGGTLVVRRSNTVSGNYDGYTTINGGLNITNTITGAYAAVQISPGSGAGQSGGALVLKSDVTFTGNTTNSATATIDAFAGSGRRGLVVLDGARTFNIGNGAAAVDLSVDASIVDGAIASGTGAGSLTKTGLGTLGLTAASTYTGGTTVSQGRVVVGSAANLGTGNVTVGSTGNLELDNNSAIADFATLTINTGGVVNLDFSNLFTENVGLLILNGTAYNTGTFDSSTPGGFFSGTGSLTVVPEPGSMAAVMIGAGMLLRRRRAKS